MEESRLKPMGDYDPKVFNQIYKDTEKLRKKLASEIDCRRFGVDYFEILSWFDVKFIFVFNKYHNKHNPDVLKGHIIRGLQFFKCRILRKAYSLSSVHIMNTVPMIDNEDYEQDFVDDHIPLEEYSPFVDLAMNFLKKRLSDDAYEFLQVQLYPPPFILKRAEEEDIKSLHKIPSSIFAEYFELGGEKGIKYINNLRQEIKLITEEAKEFFNTLHYTLPQNPKT